MVRISARAAERAESVSPTIAVQGGDVTEVELFAADEPIVDKRAIHLRSRRGSGTAR
jgi:hypothetical protein